MAQLKKPRRRKLEAQAHESEAPEVTPEEGVAEGGEGAAPAEPGETGTQAEAAEQTPTDKKEPEEPGEPEKPKLPEPWRNRRANWWTR